MSAIWIVIVADRHADADALPYSTEESAIAKAHAMAAGNARSHTEVQWDTALSDSMRRDGWVLYLPYGPEGDSIRVVRREVDAP